MQANFTRVHFAMSYQGLNMEQEQRAVCFGNHAYTAVRCPRQCHRQTVFRTRMQMAFGLLDIYQLTRHCYFECHKNRQYVRNSNANVS